jgi:cytochrome c5
MYRALLGLATVAALSTAAEAQAPQNPTVRKDQPAGQDASAGARRTSESGGAVERTSRTARRAATRTGEPRAHPRDYYGADDPRCDDLCQRERMMDARYGKDRERLPAARRP